MAGYDECSDTTKFCVTVIQKIVIEFCIDNKWFWKSEVAISFASRQDDVRNCIAIVAVVSSVCG